MPVDFLTDQQAAPHAPAAPARTEPERCFLLDDRPDGPDRPLRQAAKGDEEGRDPGHGRGGGGLGGACP